MQKLVKLIFITTFIFVTSCNTKIAAYSLDEKYVDEVINNFAKEMKKKYGLLCCSTGASMPNDVQKIIISFLLVNKPTIEEARAIEVSAIERLLELVNSHEKIRPYLAEYPFNSKRVSVSISFKDKYGERHLDGNITYVFIAKNQIFFDRAEKIIRKRHPCFDFDGKRIIPESETYEDIDLINVLKEPYEEALEKVKKSEKFLKN